MMYHNYLNLPGRPAKQMAVVASSVLIALGVLSVVVLLFVRRLCRTDSLPIAGHSAPPYRVQDTVAGSPPHTHHTSHKNGYQPIEIES